MMKLSPYLQILCDATDEPFKDESPPLAAVAAPLAEGLQLAAGVPALDEARAEGRECLGSHACDTGALPH